MPVLTLLTDFGLGDYYVAAVKGTVLRRAPGSAVTLVDVSHDVAPGDVEGAAHLLAAAAPAFPSGTVHLAVVDPGVGSERRILAAEAGGGLFVAPDNGLLTGVLAAAGEAAVTRAVERTDLFLDAPGATFHGRDRFAPVAAFLLRGGWPAELGPRIDDPVVLPLEPPRREAGRLTGRVSHVDRFGNLITDIPSAWLPPGGAFTAVVSGHQTQLRVTHYRQIPSGRAAVIPGSLGTLELSLDTASLAERWKVRRGAAVIFHLD